MHIVRVLLRLVVVYRPTSSSAFAASYTVCTLLWIIVVWYRLLDDNPNSVSDNFTGFAGSKHRNYPSGVLFRFDYV